MLDRTDAKTRGLSDLPEVEADALLALIALSNADPRPEKIDVGVGVFRDGSGHTPILQVIKKAERRLVETQATKSYLGSAGDKRFVELLRPLLLGAQTAVEVVEPGEHPVQDVRIRHRLRRRRLLVMDRLVLDRASVVPHVDPPRPCRRPRPRALNL